MNHDVLVFMMNGDAVLIFMMNRAVFIDVRAEQGRLYFDDHDELGCCVDVHQALWCCIDSHDDKSCCSDIRYELMCC